jgi:hypothetical protein
MIAPNANLHSEQTIKEQRKKDVKMSNFSTASITLCKTQLPTVTSTNVSADKNNNGNVISSSKVATALPQLVRKKSRIFEDLPKLFESNVPETNLGRTNKAVLTTPSQFQEGSCYFIFCGKTLRKLGKHCVGKYMELMFPRMFLCLGN